MYSIDLDDLPQLNSFPIGVDRFSFLSFYQKDYLTDDPLHRTTSNHTPLQGTPLKAKIIQFISRKKGPIFASSIQKIVLLTAIRYFGYSFNPVSFIFCSNFNNHLQCIIVDISNTFSQAHTYFLDASKSKAPKNDMNSSEEMKFIVKKAFHVSPFSAIDGYYSFSFSHAPPHCTTKTLKIGIDIVDSPGESPWFSTLLTLGGQKSSKHCTIPLAHSMQVLSTLLMKFPSTHFFTIPRIFKQAFSLHFKKLLPVFSRPPIDDDATYKIEKLSIPHNTILQALCEYFLKNYSIQLVEDVKHSTFQVFYPFEKSSKRFYLGFQNDASPESPNQDTLNDMNGNETYLTGSMNDTFSSIGSSNGFKNDITSISFTSSECNEIYLLSPGDFIESLSLFGDTGLVLSFMAKQWKADDISQCFTDLLSAYNPQLVPQPQNQYLSQLKSLFPTVFHKNLPKYWPKNPLLSKFYWTYHFLNKAYCSEVSHIGRIISQWLHKNEHVAPFVHPGSPTQTPGLFFSPKTAFPAAIFDTYKLVCLSSQPNRPLASRILDFGANGDGLFALYLAKTYPSSFIDCVAFSSAQKKRIYQLFWKPEYLALTLRIKIYTLTDYLDIVADETKTCVHSYQTVFLLDTFHLLRSSSNFSGIAGDDPSSLSSKKVSKHSNQQWEYSPVALLLQFISLLLTFDGECVSLVSLVPEKYRLSLQRGRGFIIPSPDQFVRSSSDFSSLKDIAGNYSLSKGFFSKMTTFVKNPYEVDKRFHQFSNMYSRYGFLPGDWFYSNEFLRLIINDMDGFSAFSSSRVDSNPLFTSIPNSNSSPRSARSPYSSTSPYTSPKTTPKSSSRSYFSGDAAHSIGPSCINYQLSFSKYLSSKDTLNKERDSENSSNKRNIPNFRDPECARLIQFDLGFRQALYNCGILKPSIVVFSRSKKSFAIPFHVIRKPEVQSSST